MGPVQDTYHSTKTFDELLALVSSHQGPRVCADSRLVRPGDIFVAVRGTVSDGHDFINQAVANGAGYVVCREDYFRDLGTTGCELICVKDPAEAAALLAQASRGRPALKLINFAVTGTNGKTTVAYLLAYDGSYLMT